MNQEGKYCVVTSVLLVVPVDRVTCTARLARQFLAWSRHTQRPALSFTSQFQVTCARIVLPPSWNFLQLCISSKEHQTVASFKHTQPIFLCLRCFGTVFFKKIKTEDVCIWWYWTESQRMAKAVLRQQGDLFLFHVIVTVSRRLVSEFDGFWPFPWNPGPQDVVELHDAIYGSHLQNCSRN